MYLGIYNDKHQILTANFPDFENITRIPTGYYDKQIMCQHCDNVILGELETYSSKVLFHGLKDKKNEVKIVNTITPDGLRVLLLDNIDYSKFKLFLLSILWRASISNHPYFNEVSLGHHEERIRLALLHGDPLKEDDYQACMLLVKKNDELPRDYILNPIKINQKIDPSFCFYMNGSFYFFSTDKNESLEIYKHGSIKMSNKMEIPVIELDFVKGLLGRVWNIKLK